MSMCLLITEQYLKDQYLALLLISFNIGEGLFMAALVFSHHKTTESLVPPGSVLLTYFTVYMHR